MRGWVVPTTAFILGLGLGLSAPMLASRYGDPYLPAFLKKNIHPLEGSVIHKERQQDRLLITITTQDGTILATFQQQVPEPFVNDPAVLRVNKHKDVTPAITAPTNPPVQSEPEPETGSTLDPPGSLP